MVASVAWSGAEHVLDVGWGNGLVLLAAAKRLRADQGKATGMDIWHSSSFVCQGIVANPLIPNDEPFRGVAQSLVVVHRAQVVFKDYGADRAAQVRTHLLVGSKMYPPVNACVGDVVGNLPERRVLQNEGGHCGIG